MEFLPLDLKNKLTHYLEMAQKGHNVIITDRGAPVAVMHNLDKVEEDAGSEEQPAYLAGQGFLTLQEMRCLTGYHHFVRSNGVPRSNCSISKSITSHQLPPSWNYPGEFLLKCRTAEIVSLNLSGKRLPPILIF